MTPVSKIQSCIGEIRQWMRDNMLALNDDQTEVVHFSSKLGDRNSASSCDIGIGGVSIAPSTTVRN